MVLDLLCYVYKHDLVLIVKEKTINQLIALTIHFLSKVTNPKFRTLDMPFAWVDSLACRTVLTIAVYSVIILTLLTNAIYKKYEKSVRSRTTSIAHPFSSPQ